MSDQNHLFDPVKNAELVEQIKKLALEDPEAVKEHACGVFTGKGGEKLVQQVVESRAIVNNVKAAFVTICATLVVIDGKKLVLHGKPVQEFAKDWQEISKLFDDVMKLSQTVAARAAHTAQRLSKVLIQVLLDPDTKKADALDVLGSFKTDVHKERENAQEISNKLTKLHQSITNFSATLVDILGDASAITKDIEAVRASIVTVNERITRLETFIKGCFSAVIGGLVGMAMASTCLSVTPLAPMIGVPLMLIGFQSSITAGFSWRSFGDRLRCARAEQTEYKAKLEALIQTKGDLIDIQGRLAKLDGEWGTIRGGLTAISEIWGAFGSSLVSIEESITDADNDLKMSGEIWQKVYLRDLKLLEATYVLLGQMLDQWAINIASVYEPNNPAPPYAP